MYSLTQDSVDSQTSLHPRYLQTLYNINKSSTNLKSVLHNTRPACCRQAIILFLQKCNRHWTPAKICRQVQS